MRKGCLQENNLSIHGFL